MLPMGALEIQLHLMQENELKNFVFKAVIVSQSK